MSLKYDALIKAGYTPPDGALPDPRTKSVKYALPKHSTAVVHNYLIEEDTEDEDDEEEIITADKSVTEPDLPPATIKSTSHMLENLEFSIPAEHFLLSSDAGDILLKPDGFTEKSDFIVLFFPAENHLLFRPAIRARFVGAYNLPDGTQLKHHLFYSGICFQLPDSERMCIIFHKISLD